MYPQKVSDNIFFNDWRIFKKQLLQSDFKLRQTENYKGLSIERLGNKFTWIISLLEHIKSKNEKRHSNVECNIV